MKRLFAIIALIGIYACSFDKNTEKMYTRVKLEFYPADTNLTFIKIIKHDRLILDPVTLPNGQSTTLLPDDVDNYIRVLKGIYFIDIIPSYTIVYRDSLDNEKTAEFNCTRYMTKLMDEETARIPLKKIGQ